MKKWLALILIALFSYVCSAAEQTAADPYSIAMPVQSQAESVRLDIMRLGLAEVMTKLTNDPAMLQLDVLAGPLEHAIDYVLEYRYTKGTTDAEPYILHVTFDKRSVRQLLKQTGMIGQGVETPVVMVWMTTVDDNKQAVIVGHESQDAVLSALMQQSQHFRLALIFPMMDMADMEKVSVDDVLNARLEDLLEDSKRYQAGAMLVGQLRKRGNMYHCAWQFVYNDQIWQFEINAVSEDQFAAKTVSEVSRVILAIDAKQNGG